MFEPPDQAKGGPRVVKGAHLVVDEPSSQGAGSNCVVGDVGGYARRALGPGHPERPVGKDHLAEHADLSIGEPRTHVKGDYDVGATFRHALDDDALWRSEPERFRRVNQRERGALAHAKLRCQRSRRVASHGLSFALRIVPLARQRAITSSGTRANPERGLGLF